MIGGYKVHPAPPRSHGDHAGFNSHRYHGEEPCGECWDGERLYQRIHKRKIRAARQSMAARARRYKRGMTDRQIATEERVSVKAVASWRKRNSLPPNRPASLDFDALVENVEWLIESREIPERIAERVGVSRESLVTRLSRRGRDDLARRLQLRDVS